jgi:hypothetical protein
MSDISKILYLEIIDTTLNSHNESLNDIVQLADKISGSLDDTNQIQTAINNASLGNGLVKLSKNQTYYVSSIQPKENVTIDLNGSTLKLKDNVQLPVFYDYGTSKNPYAKNFSVINGTIDANMQNNQSANQSSGVFWLTNWDGLFFDKLFVKNAFRNIFNLYGCNNIKIPLVLIDGNGLSGNAGGYYSYGADFESGCKNIEIGNFIVKNMYGFGIHFNNCENYKADNLIFDTFTHPSAIAVTCTQAKRGKIGNITCSNILGDNIEINACTDLEITNINVDKAGKHPLLFGDNGTGISSQRIKIANVVTTNTGANESISVNYLQNSEFNKCNFDKTLTTTANIISSDVRFVDCSFGGNMPVLAVYYGKFKFINTKFVDFLIQRLENTIGEFTNLNTGVGVANGSVLNIPITNLAKSSGGAIGGRLCVMSSYGSNFAQCTYQEYAFAFYGSTLNIAQITSVDGSYARKIAITADATNKQFVLTNSTGVDLSVKWSITAQ